MTLVRVVPGGQAAKFGVKENDKIISINNKSPANVDAAVGIIKEAGKSIKLVLVRVEEETLKKVLPSQLVTNFRGWDGVHLA